MTNLAPGQGPGGVSGSYGPKDAADQGANDPTFVSGQQPSSLFGVAMPMGTGAPGTAGASGGSDPTNEPGQLTEGISGSGPSVTSDSGAPGTTGQQNGTGGPDTISYTRPGAYLTGTYEMDTVHDNISGPGDWTQAIDGSYAGGGPQLPGVAGNEPTPNGGPYQPNSGRVLRGGYRNGQR